MLVAALVALGASSAAIAKPKGKTQLEVDVKPVGAQLFMDDKAMGKVGAARVIDLSPGFHVIRLVSKGDEHEERFKLAPNQKTIYSFEFDEAPAPNSGTGEEPAPVQDDDAPKKAPAKP